MKPTGQSSVADKQLILEGLKLKSSEDFWAVVRKTGDGLNKISLLRVINRKASAKVQLQGCDRKEWRILPSSLLAINAAITLRVDFH